MKYYLEDSVKIKLNGKIASAQYTLEYIDNAKQRLDSVKDSVITDLLRISNEAGQNPGSLVQKWYDNADGLAVARRNDREVGFAIARFFKPELIFFVASMVSNDDKNRKLGKLMNFYLLKKFTFWRLKNFGFFSVIFSPFYYIFRTQNPILYYTWYKYTKIYPSLDGGKISEHELLLVQDFINKVWPNYEFDVSSFVIHNAYSTTPGLRYKPNSIPWCKDSSINNLFKDRLDFEGDCNDSLVILGKISRLSQIYALLAKQKLV